MRITLCVNALSPEPGGIGRYTWELAKGLARKPEISELNYFARGRLIADPSTLLADEPKFPRLRRIAHWLERRKIERVLSSTLVHGPNYFLPDSAETGVVTVHDLSVFRFPESHPADRVAEFERLFLRSVERAAHIVTDTETVRRELTEMFAVSPSRVTSVPLGVSEAFQPRKAKELVGLSKWGLRSGEYALCVSTLEPRKKISELLCAWERLPAPLRERYPLVLAGGSGWRNDDLRSQVERAVGAGWLKHLGFLEEAVLPLIYSGASLFIYPSIYEGFGLPPIEAMASGVPVIVSDRSCLPEVCGDAARHVDPDDLDGFTAAIEASLTDPAWRAGAVQRGLERAAQFTWRRCIDDTVAVYRRTLGHS